MTPLSVRQQELRPEWIDYNGHLSEAYYVLLFGHGTDEVMDALGLDAQYRGASGCSLFTVEAHVRYLDEVADGVGVEVRSFVIGTGPRKLRLWHELWAGGVLRATEEVLALHVDTAAGRSVPLPGEVLHRAGAAEVALPEHAGRSITG
ncbi:thioesterase family protein [Aeromicrobium sp. CTD01-1L150]|uniref:thioesterase family protein n=1 Tax=Aeromicrobium sp. CTD01-1L150 TaxID=3341830 RepID=UPI0035C118DC